MIYILWPFAIWGLADMYITYRFVRKPQIDTTAGIRWWWDLKWSLASQTKALVTKLPWLSQDLTEALGIRPDDGEIT